MAQYPWDNDPVAKGEDQTSYPWDSDPIAKPNTAKEAGLLESARQSAVGIATGLGADLGRIVQGAGQFAQAPIATAKELGLGLWAGISDKEDDPARYAARKALAQQASADATAARNENLAGNGVFGGVGAAAAQAARSLELGGKQYAKDASLYRDIEAPIISQQMRNINDADGIDATIKASWDNPLGIAFGYIPESGVDMAAGMGVGKGVGLARSAAIAGRTEKAIAGVVDGMKAGSIAPADGLAKINAIRTAAQESATNAAGEAAMLAEAGSSANSTRVGVQDKVESTPIEMLAKNSQRFRDLVSQGNEPEKARSILALELSAESALPAAAATYIGGKLVGDDIAMGKTLMGGPMTKREILQRAAVEAAQETLQNPGEDYAQYHAERQFDPNAKFDPGKSAVLGAITGAAMGGVMHGTGYMLQSGERAKLGAQQPVTPATASAPNGNQQSTSPDQDALIAAAEGRSQPSRQEVDDASLNEARAAYDDLINHQRQINDINQQSLLGDAGVAQGAGHQNFTASDALQNYDELANGAVQPADSFANRFPPEPPRALTYHPTAGQLVVFPDGSTMTRAEYEQRKAQHEQARLDGMVQDAPLPGMMQRAVEQSAPFADAMELNTLIRDERADKDARLKAEIERNRARKNAADVPSAQAATAPSQSEASTANSATVSAQNAANSVSSPALTTLQQQYDAAKAAGDTATMRSLAPQINALRGIGAEHVVSDLKEQKKAAANNQIIAERKLQSAEEALKAARTIANAKERKQAIAEAKQNLESARQRLSEIKQQKRTLAERISAITSAAKPKSEETASAPPANNVFSLGESQESAEPITVKNGVVHQGNYALEDYETGKPVRVPEGATHAQIRKAIEDAGQVPKGHKFFGMQGDEQESSEPKKTRTRITAIGDERIGKYADDLRSMAGDVGWAEEGGKLLRDANGNPNGRTRWIPHAEWFVAGMIGTPKAAKAAVEKAVAGEPMTAKEKRTVQAMMDWLDNVNSQQAEMEALDSMGYDEMPIAEQDVIDALGDLDIDNPTAVLAASDTAQAMLSLGFTEEEIRAELKQTNTRQGNETDAGRSQVEAQGSVQERAETGKSESRGLGGAEEGLTLTGQTNAEAAAEFKRQQEEANKPDKEPPAKNVTADQVDLFNTQGGLFNSNRETPKASQPRESESRSTLPEQKEAVREITSPESQEIARLLGDELPEGGKAGIITDIRTLPSAAEATGERMSRKTAEAIRFVAQMFGRKVVFYEATHNVPEGINQDGKTLYVNVDSGVDALAVAGHEFTHSLEYTDPEAYQAALDAVVSLLKSNGRRAVKYRQYYGNKEMNTEQLARELLSDIGGNLWRDDGFFGEMFAEVQRQHPHQEARSIITRLRDAIVSFINKLIKATPKQGFQLDNIDGKGTQFTREELESVRDRIVKMAAKAFIEEEKARASGEPMYQPGRAGEVRNSQSRLASDAEEITLDNAPVISDEDYERLASVFLSDFPKKDGYKNYRRGSHVARAIRNASDAELGRLDGRATTELLHDIPLGHFSGYESRASVRENQDGGSYLVVELFGKEQREAGLDDEPALKLILDETGELTIKGPDPLGETYQEFEKRGWAEPATDHEGNEYVGWSRLTDVEPKQLIQVLGDTHARAREWQGTEFVGLHWSRATGATGSKLPRKAAMYFSTHRVQQGETGKPFTVEVTKEGQSFRDGVTAIDEDDAIRFARFLWPDADVRVLAQKAFVPDVQYSQKRNTWYYSQLSRQVEAAPDRVFSTGKQTAAWLQSNAAKLGIKADEIQWTGVLDWLNLQGKNKVSKADVLGYLQQNGVQVQEVVKGEALTIERRNAKAQEMYGEPFKSLPSENKYRVDDALRNEPATTNYEQYVLPGGENYRELLLTLPKKKATIKPDGEKFAVMLPDGRRFGSYSSRADAESALDRTDGQIVPNFQSQHWSDTKNILAHIRYNDRTDADGNKVLFIEELQSDWGQKGKKEGFSVGSHEARRKAFDNAQVRAQEAKDRVTIEARRLLNSMGIKAYREILVSDNRAELTAQYRALQKSDVAYAEADAEATRLDEIAKEEALKLGASDRMPPSAPFVTDTKSWVALAVKRMIAYAVENGYDKVAFVTGEQSAERYDLSKQVKSVTVTSLGNGSQYHVEARKSNGEKITDRAYPKDQLSDVIGKDLAEKAVADTSGSKDEVKYSGLDLKVGGEGMKSFYDRIVPQVVNDVLKKVGGGRVESVQVATRDPFDGGTIRIASDGNNYWAERTKTGERLSKNFDSYLKADDARLAVYDAEENGATPQPSFTITPEMREKVAGGQALFSRQRSIASASSLPQETRAQKSLRIVQDKFNRFKLLADWLEKQGLKLSEMASVYLAEERFHGRTATRIEDFREETIKPLIAATQKAGFTLTQVAEFLEAQHTAEANAQARKIHHDPNATAAGVTDQEAAAYLASAPNGLEAIANRWRNITNDTRKLLLDSGIVDQDTIDAWQGVYQHYVPLKGADKKTQGGTGSGLSTNGKQKRRLGHEKRDEWIVENILRDHERAILLSEKNLVGHHLLQFLFEANNDDIGTVGKPEKRAVLRPGQAAYEVLYHGSLVQVFTNRNDAHNFVVSQGKPGEYSIRESRDDPSVAYMAAPMLQPNEAQVYVKGKAIRVQLNDELLARAYKNLGAEQLGTLLGAAREVNTYLSKAYTGYNPEFFATNVIRDFTTGVINLTGEEGARFALKTIRNYPAAFKNLLIYAKTGRASSDITSYRANGGSTGAAYLSDLERIGADAIRAYQDAAGVKETYRTHGKKAAARVVFDKTIETLAHYIEVLNQAGENAMRLAAFNTALQNGLSMAQAASLAKNCTVNFNRKGELGSQLSALYLFANPNIQGTAALVKALTSSKHKWQARALTGGLMMLGYTMAQLLNASGDDKKIPENERDRNFVISIGDKIYKMPVPYGYGFFYALGTLAADIASGKITETAKMALRVASSFSENFSPFGNPWAGDKADAKNVVQLMPITPAKWVAQMAANRNSFGGVIYPDFGDRDHRPDSQKMNRTTKGGVSAWLAESTNELTGGNKVRPGWVDVSPESINFMTRNLVGGTGKFIGDSTMMMWNIAVNGVAPDIHEVPIVRKFVGEERINTSRARFYDAANEVKEAADELANARKLRDPELYKATFDENRELIAIGQTAQAFRKMATALRDQEDKVMADDSKTLSEKRLIVKGLEMKESDAYERFMKIYRTQKDKRRERAG